jgi:NADPH:quinone reductase-like Zn-dependent oxidoreductase
VATAYGGPEVLAVIEVDPGEPGPGHVLVKVRAAGVNPADWKAYTGAFGTNADRLPLRLGYEAAGEVLAVGTGVTAFTPGDAVIAYRASGAYADRLVLPEASLVPKPPELSWEQAAGLLLAGTTAWHALAATDVHGGDTLLVHGAAGGVGDMVTQLALLRGARVIGTARPQNHDWLRALGAEPVAYGPGLVDRVRTVLRGPFDTVTAAIDTVGTDEALETSVAMVADRGRIASIAGFRRGSELGIRLLGGGPGADPGDGIRASARTELAALAAAGRLVVTVAATYPLADVATAHRDGMAGHSRGKIILVP